MKRISWIASYPKSGNTWFRAFLTALLGSNLEGPILEELEGGPIASSKEMFDLEAGVDSCELTVSEIQRIRPDVFRSYASRSSERLYLKIHDARVDRENGIDIIPPDATQGAIYLIRNPLDIAASWANHSGTSLEKSTDCLINETHILAKASSRKFANQVQQFLGSWSDHVRSWTDCQDFPVLAIRYENLLAAPLEHFSRAQKFLEIDKTSEQVEQAIASTRFETLQSYEAQHGFKERPKGSKQFFRKGKSGSWREELPAECAKRIIDAHGETMRRFGYLDASGKPTC